jgi:hypothetical protein
VIEAKFKNKTTKNRKDNLFIMPPARKKVKGLDPETGSGQVLAWIGLPA